MRITWRDVVLCCGKIGNTFATQTMLPTPNYWPRKCRFLHASVQLSVIRMTSCFAFKILTSTSPPFFSQWCCCLSTDLTSAAYLLQPPDSHFLFFFQRIRFMLGRLVPVCLFFCFCNVCPLCLKIFTTLSHEELRKN